MSHDNIDRSPSSTFESTPAGSRGAAWAFRAVVALCVTWVLAHAWATDRILTGFAAAMDADRGTASDGLPVILRYMAFDGYLWVRHADHLGEDGRLRLRRTDFDNAPHGREVHWNSAFAWYLRGLGALRRLFVEEPRRVAIARMGIWANSILLVVFLMLIARAAARRFGTPAGIATALGMIFASSFYEGFYPAYPDHHGIISTALLGCLFGLLWAGNGWVVEGTDDKQTRSLDGARRPGRSGVGDTTGARLLPAGLLDARRGIWISALCGAAGFWLSAISMALAMIGVGLGLVAVALFGATRHETRATYYPELWRLWGRVGGVATLGFYLLEYFPSWPRLRLEVNHPLYALAWWGAGEGLAIFTEWLVYRRRGAMRFPLKQLILPAVAVSLLPILVWLLGERVHAARDPFLAAVHTHISEFKSAWWRIQHQAYSWLALWGAFPLLVIVGLAMLGSRKTSFGVRVAMLDLLGPIVFITALHAYQVRWQTLNGPALILLGAVVVSELWHRLGRSRRPVLARSWAAAVLLLLFSFQPLREMIPQWTKALTSAKRRQPDWFEGLHLVMRDIAATLRRNAGGKPITLLSSPNSSVLLASLGDFRTIGTLYWENAEGLKAAARMFAAQTDEEALRLMRDRGVTHIALINWENFIEPYVRILMPEGGDAAVINSFGIKALFKRIIPVWCRPIPYPRYPLLHSLGLDVLLLEVRPDQTFEEAWFFTALYHRNEGRPEQAEPILRQLLEEKPERNLARMELAALLADTGRTEEAAGEFIVAFRSIRAGPEREALIIEAARRLLRTGDWASAISLLETFPHAIEPDRSEGAHRVNLLAWLLATAREDRLRDPVRALRLLEVIREKGAAAQVPWGDTQAAALAALGRFDEAIAVLERHIAGLKADDATPQTLQLLQERLALYRRGTPWTEPRQAAAETPSP